ncbi:MAG: hypothetical protein HRU20_29905 [Pseudomonadales bacterium]|nr:hypothetical protein [Pseudomonadales bacterium]
MLDQELYYKLEISASGIRCYVNINGVQLQEETEGDVLNVDIPVNALVRSGSNVIDFELYPWKETGSFTRKGGDKLSIALKVVNASTVNKEEVTLAKLIYKAPGVAETGFEASTKPGEYNFPTSLNLSTKQKYLVSDIKINEDIGYDGAKRFLLTVDMPTPFPEWKFFSSDVITDPETLSEEEALSKLALKPFKILEDIHSSILKNDLASILPYFKERNNELDIAMYQPKGTYEDKLRLSLQESIDEHRVFDDLDLEYSYPNVNHTKKLLWLGARPVIYCWDKDEVMFTGYETIFRKDGDNWIITR